MRAMFSSKFPDIERIRDLARENIDMLYDDESGQMYMSLCEHISKMHHLSSEDICISDAYSKIGVKPFGSLSKRFLYKMHDSGIVVGAGSGEDCADLIGKDDWHLYDLTDERMINNAIGHYSGKALFNKASSKEGDSLNDISEKHKTGECEIDCVTIDGLNLEKCGLISVDAEGAGLDVLQGAIQTINRHSPDLLLSIYHNWQEYLLIIPMVYDLGYEIVVAKTSNFTPSQPHLELTLICKKEYK